MLDSNVPRPWQGRTTLVFSLAAVALGLGNIFRMPWLIGENGGGPFVLAYVCCLLLFTVPLMTAEVMLGSFGRASPLGSLRWAVDQSGRSHHWQWLGLLQTLLALLLAFQVVLVSVWMLDRAVVLQAGSLAAASAHEFATDFSQMARLDVQSGWGVGGMLFLASVLAVLGPGFAMAVIGWLVLPAILVTLVGVADYSLQFGDLAAAEEWLLQREPTALTTESLFAALLSAAFTLGVGVGIGVCFGGRAPTGLPLLRSVMASAVIDTLLMLLVALTVVPLLYAVNAEPAQGIALVFVLIPYAFGNLPLGEAYGALFFAATAAAGFAALVALLEPAIMILRRDLQWPRALSAVVVVGVLWSCFALVADEAIEWLRWIDKLLAVALPTSGLLLALFVGWRMPRPMVRGEFYRAPRWLFFGWWMVLRWLVPVSLVVLLVIGFVSNFGLSSSA